MDGKEIYKKLLEEIYRCKKDHKEPDAIRMTCEQWCDLKADAELCRLVEQGPVSSLRKLAGYNVVLRGSMLDSQYRDSPRKFVIIDLTKVE